MTARDREARDAAWSLITSAADWGLSGREEWRIAAREWRDRYYLGREADAPAAPSLASLKAGDRLPEGVDADIWKDRLYRTRTALNRRLSDAHRSLRLHKKALALHVEAIKALRRNPWWILDRCEEALAKIQAADATDEEPAAPSLASLKAGDRLPEELWERIKAIDDPCYSAHKDGWKCVREIEHEMPHVATKMNGVLVCDPWTDEEVSCGSDSSYGSSDSGAERGSDSSVGSEGTTGGTTGIPEPSTGDAAVPYTAVPDATSGTPVAPDDAVEAIVEEAFQTTMAGHYVFGGVVVGHWQTVKDAEGPLKSMVAAIVNRAITRATAALKAERDAAKKEAERARSALEYLQDARIPALQEAERMRKENAAMTMLLGSLRIQIEHAEAERALARQDEGGTE